MSFLTGRGNASKEVHMVGADCGHGV